MHFYAMTNNLANIKILLKYLTEKHPKNKDKETPLECAADYGNDDIVIAISPGS